MISCLRIFCLIDIFLRQRFNIRAIKIKNIPQKHWVHKVCIFSYGQTGSGKIAVLYMISRLIYSLLHLFPSGISLKRLIWHRLCWYIYTIINKICDLLLLSFIAVHAVIRDLAAWSNNPSNCLMPPLKSCVFNSTDVSPDIVTNPWRFEIFNFSFSFSLAVVAVVTVVVSRSRRSSLYISTYSDKIIW